MPYPSRPKRSTKMYGPSWKWIVLLVWLALAAAANVFLPSVSEQENNNAPNLPSNMPSVAAAGLADAEFASESGSPALIVWHRQGGLQPADLDRIAEWGQTLAKSPVPYQASIPPLNPGMLRGLLSADGSTAVTPVVFRETADADQLKEGIAKLKDAAVSAMGGDPFGADAEGGTLAARVTGPVGIQIDATGLFQNADVSLMIATVLLVVVLLLFIYRSPLLVLIPLVTIGFAYALIAPLLGWMAAEGWITVDSQAVSIMTVLLFGAGTDYSLFLIVRFRQMLLEEQSKILALKKAFGAASGAIAMSGLTVVLSLLALLAARYGAFHRFAVPFSVSIFVMGVASLTLLPALLSVFGRASFFPFVPRTPGMEAERAKRHGKSSMTDRPAPRYRIGNLVVRRPVWVLLVSCAVLGALAAFMPQIRYTYDLLSSFPKDMPSREGFAIIGKQFPEGDLAPVRVIVDTEGKTADFGSALKALPFVAEVSGPEKGRTNAALQSYELSLDLNPYSAEAMDRIPDIRQTAERSLQGAGIPDSGGKVWIAGQTADQYDTRQAVGRDMKTIIPIVVGMIALLLLLYLRSIVATVYLVLTVVLSFFSALGLGWLILHYGMGADAIQGSIPLYAFVFLVALGEDYNIFMVSSIWRKSKNKPLRQAIREGVGETGSVITSAGLILAGTFAVLATLPIQVLVQFGIITALGVLLDTFLVRPFLVPAITLLLGRWAFWPSRQRAEVSGNTQDPSF